MKALKTIATIGLLSCAFQANALNNADGVIFDPDWTDGSTPPIEQDFIGKFDFTQWYTSAADASGIGSLDSYNDAVTIGTVFNSLDGTTDASGYVLQGGGEFYRINDPLRDVITSSATGGGLDSFCPGCELTYAFGGIGLNKDETFDLTNAWARIYIDDGAINNLSVPISSLTEAQAAIGDRVWLDLKITDLYFTAGDITSGFVEANFDIIGGSAADYFDPKSLSYNGSAFFGTTPSQINLDSRYSNGGNGAVIGNTTAVPEPSTLALLGFGLLAAASRRKVA